MKNEKDLQIIVDRWMDELGVYDDKMTAFAREVVEAVLNEARKRIPPGYLVAGFVLDDLKNDLLKAETHKE